MLLFLLVRNYIDIYRQKELSITINMKKICNDTYQAVHKSYLEMVRCVNRGFHVLFYMLLAVTTSVPCLEHFKQGR
jgi:hypothetical protein